MIRVALAQINSVVGDIQWNQKLILENIACAQKLQADIVVFPELAVCGYPPEDLLFKRKFISDNESSIKEIVQKVKGITAIVGFVDKDKQSRLYNAAAVIRNGKMAGMAHKRELPNYGVFDEKRYFTEGKESPVFGFCKTFFAVNICEDIWVDKSVYYQQSKAGAKLLINLSSSPYYVGKLQVREKLLKLRAQQTKAYICYVNSVGGQDELIFDGGSLMVSPKGGVLALGRQFHEDLVIADLDIPGSKGQAASQKYVYLDKTTDTPDKKPELQNKKFKRLNRQEEIFNALVLGTKDYVVKNGFKKVIIGVSGGIDSALVAVVAVKALGKENVIAVTMPSRFSSSETLSDAKKLAGNLGIKIIETPIEKIFRSYLETLSGEFAGLPLNIAEENIQARIRGNILMALSNKFGWLVLTTGNKSEIAVGYCTLYGDMSGGFAVIKDVPKTVVYELAEFVNKAEDSPIPSTVIDRAPTAELRENQKDQDSLPPYEVLDQILKAYIEEHQSYTSMTQKHLAGDIVKKVMQMVDKSEYKRRQAPPGIKITSRAFGKDWRLPITNRYKEL